MSQYIPSETHEYERLVDGLRTSNSAMAAAIRKMIDAGDGLIAAIDGTTDQFEQETATFSTAVSAAENTLPDAVIEAATPQIITVTVEGGIVQDVTGIPAGYEVHVEDYDAEGTSHPSWNAEKQCFIVVFHGGAA